MSEYALSRLDSIAQEINAKVQRLALDMIDIGKSLNEAKTLVPHGRWSEWLRTNTTISERMAQQMMQAHARFGTVDAAKGIQWGKVVQMLSLPAGKEEEFLQEHDVNNMSVREVKSAVKEENDKIADLQQKIDILQEQVDSANAAKDKAVADMEREKSNALQIKEQFEDTFADIEHLRKENVSLNHEIKSKDQMIQMLNDQASISMPFGMEPEDRTPDTSFSVESWAVSVASFIAQNAMLPYSATTFATMRADEKKIFFREAQKLQSWLDSVMEAARNEALVV